MHLKKNNKIMMGIDIKLLCRPLSFLLLFSLLAGCAETALVVHTAKEIVKISKPPVPKGDASPSTLAGEPPAEMGT